MAPQTGRTLRPSFIARPPCARWACEQRRVGLRDSNAAAPFGARLVLRTRPSFSSPPLPAALFRGIGLAWLLGPGRHRRRLRQHQQELAVVDAGERLADDPGEHLAGVLD